MLLWPLMSRKINFCQETQMLFCEMARKCDAFNLLTFFTAFKQFYSHFLWYLKNVHNLCEIVLISQKISQKLVFSVLSYHFWASMDSNPLILEYLSRSKIKIPQKSMNEASKCVLHVDINENVNFTPL